MDGESWFWFGFIAGALVRVGFIACDSISQHAKRAGSVTCRDHQPKGNAMNLWTVIVVLLILALIGALPGTGGWHSYGYWPSGGIGLVIVVILLVFLLR